MSWFLTVIFLVTTLTFHTPSEAIYEEIQPSAVVVGTVYCDTCFQEDFSNTSHFISDLYFEGEHMLFRGFQAMATPLH
ncbi:hypothetical protein DVH24_032062 [Malus domestica]|uniref:Uncharacterized protein n=1 Tax=Malus domestica TaxID=3750 RepID=A0A498J4S9_MALDO|nr:hypothetical protein DVH24_032062 [Malus domestica]